MAFPWSPGQVLTASALNDEFGSKPTKTFGTAAPGSPTDGDIWYDANDTPASPKFWDGSQFNRISDLVLLGAVSLSGSSVSLQGVFNSNFTMYRMVVFGTFGSNTFLRFRYLNGATPEIAADYTWQVISFTGITNNSGAVTSGATSALVTGYANLRFWASADIFDPIAILNTTMVLSGNSVQPSAEMFAHRQNNTNSHDGIQIFSDSGAAFTTGQVKIYGYK
jgi:hypothetical protein